VLRTHCQSQVNDRLTRWLEEEEGPNSSNIQQYSRLPREALLGGEDTEAVQAKWLEQVHTNQRNMVFVTAHVLSIVYSC
jgi:hypothetical protein